MFALQKNAIEKRSGTVAESEPTSSSTWCGVARSTSLLQRMSISPMFTAIPPAMGGMGIHSPSIRCARSPDISSCASSVIVPSTE